MLNVAEIFHSICGEGVTVGNPAVFLRLQGCTLTCGGIGTVNDKKLHTGALWRCDSIEVWKKGKPYTTQELIEEFKVQGFIKPLLEGAHLVLTGGSPLKQQEGLAEFIAEFMKIYEKKPYIEIENECTLMPISQMEWWIDCWNNSPKLENSGMKKMIRYKPEILKKLSNYKNSWFKFVITSKADWLEIMNDFILEGLIKKEQVILMPEGSTREELQHRYNDVVDICKEYNVRFSDRMQVTMWNKVVHV